MRTLTTKLSPWPMSMNIKPVQVGCLMKNCSTPKTLVDDRGTVSSVRYDQLDPESKIYSNLGLFGYPLMWKIRKCNNILPFIKENWSNQL